MINRFSMPLPATDMPPSREIYSISRLNREARALLETGFPLLWVEGELSNLARPSSGHLYFTLKDSFAQARCAMFRMRNRYLIFRPENGQQVRVRVRVSLYENRGEFQLLVEHMEEAGDGALRRAFEVLKKRLETEGLFDEPHKKPLPALPRRIGVITSPTGAALRDILSVLRRRFPAIEVLVYPVPVQGEGAAQEIARMIRLASARAECDVLIVARGGGSLEDLWAFNEETVARALFASALPVVTGVGHEIDFTIADFVADHRAPTPSAAAELLSPDGREWLQHLEHLERRLSARCMGAIKQSHQQLIWLERRLQQQHPGQRLRNQMQRLDELEQRLKYAQRAQHRRVEARVVELSAHLRRHTPKSRIETLLTRLAGLQPRLRGAMHSRLERDHNRLASLTRELDAVSPLATLGRGYAIVSREPDGKILRDARGVQKGDRVQARLGRGRLTCRVEKAHPP